MNNRKYKIVKIKRKTKFEYWDENIPKFIIENIIKRN